MLREPEERFIMSITASSKLAMITCLLAFLSLCQQITTSLYNAFPSFFLWLLELIQAGSSLLKQWFLCDIDGAGKGLQNSFVKDKRAAKRLARECGLECEEHYVVTSDGHILALHHCYLPPSPESPRGPPVLLMHGLMQDAESFLCGGSQSIVHALVHGGYDVWLGNNRGSKYSLGHTTLAVTDKQYWDFCIDDLAHFDVPALIAEVLRLTRHQQLAYIGFSQGSAQAFAALCRHRQLSRKVSIFVALAPAVSSPGLHDDVLAGALSAEGVVYGLLGRGAVLPSCELWRSVLSRRVFACAVEKAMQVLFGWSCGNICPSRRLALFQHAYSPSSVKCVVHWFQIIQAGALGSFVESRGKCKYCGLTGGRVPDSLPPCSPCVCSTEAILGSNRYDLTAIDCSVAVFYGEADNLIDAKVAVDNLQRCVYVQGEPLYEHLDMLWADSAAANIFPKVVNLLGQYHRGVVGT